MPNSEIRVLRNTAAVIDAIGGQRLQALTGKSSQCVTNWRRDGNFPPELFLIMRTELERLKCEAPPKLWRIKEPKKEKVPA